MAYAVISYKQAGKQTNTISDLLTRMLYIDSQQKFHQQKTDKGVMGIIHNAKSGSDMMRVAHYTEAFQVALSIILRFTLEFMQQFTCEKAA